MTIAVYCKMSIETKKCNVPTVDWTILNTNIARYNPNDKREHFHSFAYLHVEMQSEKRSDLKLIGCKKRKRKKRELSGAGGGGRVK